MRRNVTANLWWQLSVECPKCEAEFDAAEQDAENDNLLANMVFNNKWDDAAGFELRCPICEHEFEIDGIEF